MPKGDHKLLSYTEESYRKKLYREGLNDNQMAIELNKTREAMRQWRKKNKLKSNNPRICKDALYERFKRYKLGWTDRELAMSDGVGTMAIVTWRSRHGLEPN